MRKREYKFTLEDVLLLIDYNREYDEKIVISDQCEEESWIVISTNNSLLWSKENLERKVTSIGVHDEMLQIWLARPLKED